MTLAPDPVLLDVTPDGVAVVTLNRAAKRNAFDEQMIAALSDTFETLRAADHVRVVFLRGAGATFCAGADLEWMRRQGQHSREDNETDARALAHMLKALYDLPQLTVALAHGAAMGGGAGLVAACDVAVARADTQFRFSEVRLGLTPATISPYVVEAIGPRWARALFTTAETFDGRFAEKIGLVQYAVDTDADLEAMMRMLANLAFEAAPGAVAASKDLVRDVAGKPITEALGRDTARRIADRRASAEGKEGIAAFLERRAPSWKSGG